jgi:hypothetical protein
MGTNLIHTCSGLGPSAPQGRAISFAWRWAVATPSLVHNPGRPARSAWYEVRCFKAPMLASLPPWYAGTPGGEKSGTTPHPRNRF